MATLLAARRFARESAAFGRPQSRRAQVHVTRGSLPTTLQPPRCFRYVGKLKEFEDGMQKDLMVGLHKTYKNGLLNGGSQACYLSSLRPFSCAIKLTRAENPIFKGVVCCNYLGAKRHFAKLVDDEVDDGVEARLMGDDGGERPGIYADGGDFGMDYSTYGSENAFADWQGGEDLEEKEDEMQAQVPTRVGGFDESDGNDPSDEEFEGECGEELDELLANTNLFEPPEEVYGEEYEYNFRQDSPGFWPGMQYDPEDLDLSRPFRPRKREPRRKQSYSVEEVKDKADFRNVRFLTRFLSETGDIIARKEFNMRTKSHNRVTRAIKTARFFALIPYSNMGKPKYVFNQPYDEMDEVDDAPPKQAGAMPQATSYQAAARFNQRNGPPGWFGQGGPPPRYGR